MVVARVALLALSAVAALAGHRAAAVGRVLTGAPDQAAAAVPAFVHARVSVGAALGDRGAAEAAVELGTGLRVGANVAGTGSAKPRAALDVFRAWQLLTRTFAAFTREALGAAATGIGTAAAGVAGANADCRGRRALVVLTRQAGTAAPGFVGAESAVGYAVALRLADRLATAQAIAAGCAFAQHPILFAPAVETPQRRPGVTAGGDDLPCVTRDGRPAVSRWKRPVWRGRRPVRSGAPAALRTRAATHHHHHEGRHSQHDRPCSIGRLGRNTPQPQK